MTTNKAVARLPLGISTQKMALITQDAITTNKDSRTTSTGINLIANDHGWGSAWWNQSVDLTKDWSSTFTINASGGSGTSDGLTFTINGDTRGLQAIGDGGGNKGFFGYDTGGGVSNSYAITFNMWASYGTASLLGFAGSNRVNIPQGTIQLPISLTNNIYTGEIRYSSNQKMLSVNIGGSTYTNSIDLGSTIGRTGYLGFTAANGGGTMDMNVSTWNIEATPPTANSNASLSIFTVDPVVYVTEGQTANITIRRTGNLTDSHYIRLGESWRSSQLPAKIGEDFLGDFVGRELTILPNQSEISFQVSTIEDTIHEDLRSINWNGRGEWFDVIASISNGIRSNTPVKWENLPGYDSPEGQTRIFINDNDQPTPTYSLSPSSTSINEGSALTTTVSTTNVASGTTLYYSLSGTGITTADFSSGSLTGSGTVSSSGSFSFSHTLANDLTTEGTETLQIRLFTDSSRSTQVASTTVSINDTSLTPTSNVTVNGNNNGIANAGTINNNGTINTGTINNNSGNTTNNITNTTVNNTNIVYNYFTNTTNNVNSNNTTNNVNSNNTLNTWNIFRVDATVKVADIVNQWFGTAAPIAKQTQDVTDTKLLDINASTWTDKIQINRVAKATENGDILEALMPELGGDPRVGSVLNGGAGKDEIRGRAGWDVLDGGNGDDLIRGGNGRDIITGGLGRDELHGDFGWNTYKSEKDGFSDLIAIKSDQYLSNWIYGKAGNNADGAKCDIIEGLDAIDKIKIIGVDTRDITFAANVTAKGLTGIGIYGKGALEALYTGGDLTINQITQMTSGDASAAAMANQVNSYGTW